MARPTSLRFTGTKKERTDAAGNIVVSGYDRYIVGIPARDLSERDIAQLSEEQLTQATGGKSPLYVETKAKSETKDAPKSEAKDDAPKASKSP